MKNRTNKIFEIAAKKAIEMVKESHYVSAKKILVKTGLPESVIERVINEPNNVRHTDMK